VRWAQQQKDINSNTSKLWHSALNGSKWQQFTQQCPQLTAVLDVAVLQAVAAMGITPGLGSLLMALRCLQASSLLQQPTTPAAVQQHMHTKALCMQEHNTLVLP
jgi:hypothetical protein